jgi:ribulose-phosphate 3-epimerase
MAVSINPSILSANLANLTEECVAIQDCCDYFHVDVMDYHFVPNLTFGLPVVEHLLKVVEKPLDCHLMIENPERWASAYAEIGAQSVTFHFEASSSPMHVISNIKQHGSKVGLAIKPATKLDDVIEYFDHIDMLLVMTVEPGFSGQSFMADMMPKVRRARELIRERNLPMTIQVDGGVSTSTIEECAENGADVFVCGHGVFRAEDPRAACIKLRSLALNAQNGAWWT